MSAHATPPGMPPETPPDAQPKADASGQPTSPRPAASRRGWLAAAGVGALAAGAGLSWWRLRPQDPAAGALAALWQLSPETPDGAQMPLQAFQGRPLVLNFWATWCPPCVKEMPELDQFARRFGPAGWQVLGLAVDQAAPVREFLGRTPVSFPVALAGPAGLSLLRDLGNPSGGLPFTVLIGAKGEVLQRKLGPTDLAELSRWAGGGAGG